VCAVTVDLRCGLHAVPDARERVVEPAFGKVVLYTREATVIMVFVVVLH
jgi:hypothetical protein